jgi:hypothetical protein
MKRMALVLAWAFVGFTAAFQALVPPFHARAAQEQPTVIGRAAASPLQAPNLAARTIDDNSGISPRNGCATIPILQRERGISPAKSRTGWNAN